jgi:hypothetical protein
MLVNNFVFTSNIKLLYNLELIYTITILMCFINNFIKYNSFICSKIINKFHFCDGVFYGVIFALIIIFVLLM